MKTKTINNFKSFLIIIFFSINVKSQVGINTNTPTAALDILSKDKGTTNNDLDIKNSDKTSIFKVNNSGDISFYKALMPNGDPGSAGKYLVSQGADKPPIWQELKKNTAVQIFSAQRNTVSSKLVNTLEIYTLDFPTINSVPGDNYGVWNSTNNRFTVYKKGIYNITVGIDADNLRTNNRPNSAGNFALRINTSVGSPTGAVINYLKASNQYNISTTVTYSVVLEANDYIYATGNSGNSTWYQGPSFISIQYSELP